MVETHLSTSSGRGVFRVRVLPTGEPGAVEISPPISLSIQETHLSTSSGRGVFRGQVITVNRTAGEVEVGTCEGLKKNAELGIDISIVVTANLRCVDAITLPAGVEVSIGSAPDENFLVAVAEDFLVPDPTSASLLVNPEGSYLALDRLTFANEAGVLGSPGEVRAVWNAGQLDVDGCVFESLSFSSQQDGGGIYSMAEPGSGSSAFVSVRNSTFIGNVAENHGGAISSWGQGELEVSNCSFVGNEAVGAGSYRRAGAGGAVYASPGVFVTVLNSSFEGCLGRYGGAALFACGANIYESTFDSNEATGLFGAIVNGDLSDEERANATLSLGGGGQSGNYTCPPLFVSGTMFESNSASTGYGGAIASVDSSLSVFNSSVLSTLGGGIYFGTSDDSGRDQLELELLQFNWNGGSSSSPDLVGSALLLERTGTPASNTTGPLEQVDPSTSSASSSSVATAALQTVGGSSSSSSAAATAGSTLVGVARDIYCFQNDPYDCEAYFGDSDGEIAVQLTGTVRCNACQGSAFTGIGSAAGAPTPAPIVADDDDGLSQMGQERAQGGTPSPAGVDGSSSSSSGAGSGLGLVPEEESEPDLLGTTGTMRRKGRGERALELAGGGGGDAEEGSTSAMVGPRPLPTPAAADDTAERGLRGTNNGNGFGNGGGSSKSQHEFWATSPGTSAAVNVNGEQSQSRSGSRRAVAGAADPSSSSSRRPSGTGSSRSSSRRPSGAGDLSRSSSRRPSGKGEDGGGRDPRRETVDSAVAVVNVETPLSSELRELELARQRSVELKAAREEEGWMSPPLVSAWGEGAVVGGNGHVALSARNTPTKRGFAVLPDDATAGEERRGRRGSRRSEAAAAAASRRGGESSPSERPKRNHSSAEAAEAAAVSVSVPRGMKGRKSRSAGKSRSGARPFGGGREDDEDEDSEVPAPSRGMKDRRSKSADKAIGHAFAPQDGSALLPERRGSRSGPRAYGSGGLTANGNPRKIKPPATGGGGDSDRFTPSRETSTGRALARAVKTPAGGARLPISVAAAAGGASVGPPRGFGSTSTSTAAADAAGAAAELGRRQRGGEAAAVVSAEVVRPDIRCVLLAAWSIGHAVDRLPHAHHCVRRKNVLFWIIIFIQVVPGICKCGSAA
ncbi:conserved unknown protein [Ectocarpus siliculosus]|uniref:Right handed beta helix domain-containing protein n=1 Tax=Ectocarpus siliculosus TaxID=2880 RepID=D7G311_ECTSI|nr:conserved unknown protein [Ectocarpus siliculosus]|eukprot:CBJ48868.1 conserved unknown protein [Ectocarpus siliculosus]